MTATERLRALLDERGVKNVWKFDGNKMWDSDGKCSGTIYETQWESPDGLRHLTFTEYPNKERTTRLVVAWHPTPEQAIAATLGPGTCRMEHLWSDDIDGVCWWCKACDKPAFTHGDFQPNYCPNCGRKVVE